MKYFNIILLSLIFFGCNTVNTIKTKNGTKIRISTPKDSKNKTPIKISVISEINDNKADFCEKNTKNAFIIPTLEEISVQTATAYDNEVELKEVGQNHIYNISAIVLFCFGIWMMFLKVPKEMISGACVSFSGMALGIFARSLSGLSKVVIVFSVIVLILSLMYILIVKFKNKLLLENKKQEYTS